MNLFQISSIILFFSSLSFGLFVYASDRKSLTNRAWLWTAISIGLWGLGLYGVTSSLDSTSAMRWQYLLDISAICIPAFYYNYVTEFIGTASVKKNVITSFLVLFFSLFSLSALFKEGMAIVFGFYWIKTGPYYFLFPIYFVGLIIVAVYELFVAYRKETVVVEIKGQIKYQILAGTIGFFGGITTFFPQLFHVYPFGNYFIIMYVGLMGYSIMRHGLFNAKSIIAELFAGAIVIVFLANLLTSTSLQEWIVRGIFFILSGLFSFLLVVSVRKEIEARKEVEQLARKLESTNFELKSANEKLKKLDLLKSKFLSLASHQLRNPISAVKTCTSMFLDGSFGAINDLQRKMLDQMFQRSEDMNDNIEKYLTIAKIDQGGMIYNLEEIELSELVSGITERQKISAEARKLTLTFEMDGKLPYMVSGDKVQLKQVLQNLIDNSMKYTKEGWIKAKLSKDEINHTIRIAISDSGMGIKPEIMPQLFQEFSRGEGAKVDVGGSGIGLYLVKEIVENGHKGKVWAESAGAGKGSTFIVELPMS